MNSKLGLGLRRLSGLGLRVVFVLLFADCASSSKYDRENWVNPDDMINYDRASKTMTRRNENNREFQANEQNIDLPNYNGCKKEIELEKKWKEKLSNCENTLSKLENQLSNLVSQPESESQEDGVKKTCGSESKIEYQYMRRFVNILLQASGLVDSSLEAGETKRSPVSIEVTSEHLATLQRFGTAGSSVSLGELDDALSHVVRSPDIGFHLPPAWLERFAHVFSSTDVMYKLLPYGITLVTLTMLAMRRQVHEIAVTFFILVLALSYQWTYDYMLKTAEIKQYIALKKYDDMPASCRASATWSLFEYLAHRLTGDTDECRKYHTARMMEPAMEVTPTVVLSEMLSAAILHPAGAIGDGIARFSGGILGGLPMFWNWVVLLLSFVLLAVVIVVVVVVLCGGRLRLPYLLSGLEVTGQSARPVMGPRVSVQEIANPVPSGSVTAPPTNPLVSALSSSSEGLVLMNMPILERLMSVRDERRTHRDPVQQLASAEDPARSVYQSVGAGDATPTACCSQCKGGDNIRGIEAKDRSELRRVVAAGTAQGSNDTLHEATGGRGDYDRRVATVDTARGSNVVSRSDARLGGGDSVRRVVSDESKAEEREPCRASSFVDLASGDNADVPCSSDKRAERPPSGTRPEIVEGSRAGEPDFPSVESAGDPLEKSEFIDELRRILEENDSFVEEPSTTEAADPGTNPRGGIDDAEGRPDFADTLENLLTECTAELTLGSSGVGEVSNQSSAELTRKVSTDSSDASGDFVKI